MLDSLSDRLKEVFKKLSGRGKLTEQDVNEALREVRRALLEADVSLKVVQTFVQRVRAKAVGEEMWNSLTPGQLVIKIVRDELVNLMGGEHQKLSMASQPPTVVMLMGLNGAGKTTTCGKLALHLRGQGHKPMMVAADVQRPAAITQLQVLGKQLDIPVFADTDDKDPVSICSKARAVATKEGRNLVLVDTAGRLHVDDGLMDELEKMKAAVKPHEVLLVVDAMTGQDAVNLADVFNQRIGVDGIVMTKLDGDARGGAALSVREVTGKPIKYLGVGEKLSGLEPFHPDRLVSRILGMGDVLSLIEKAEAAISEEDAQEMAEKFTSGDFNLEDFLDSLAQIKKMGPLTDLLAHLPGMPKSEELASMIDPKAFSRIEAIIYSMTPGERRNPRILNASRRKRIAAGSGMEVQDINRLMTQFEQMKKIMKMFGGGGGGGGRRRRGGPMRLPFFPR